MTEHVEGRPLFRPRGRIIKKQDVDLWRSGQDYLDAATRQADQLKRDAIDAFEDARVRGFEEGRKEGATAAASLLLEIRKRADHQLASADRQLIDLALAVVRQVLGTFDIRDLTRKAVLHALDDQRDGQRLTLHVAPDMAAALDADMERHLTPDARRLITVNADPDQAPGQCRLASDIGFVDLDIDTQLNAIHRGLGDALDGENARSTS